MAGGLLFINKNANSRSLSRSHGTEKYLIGSHVQLGKLQAKRARTTPKSHALGFRRATGSDQASDLDEEKSFLQLYTSVPGEGNAVDPFQASCIPINKEVHDILQFFLKISQPNQWITEVKTPSNTNLPFQMNAESILQRYFSIDWQMYPLLASVSGQLAAYVNPKWQGATSFYIQMALVKMRERLQTLPVVDFNIIISVWVIGAAELLRRDYHAAMVHFKVCKTLIDQIGGLKAVTGQTSGHISTEKQHVIGILIYSDARTSIVLGVPPLYLADEFDPGLPVVDDTKLNSKTGSNFVSFQNRIDIPESLSNILLSLARCNRTLIYCASPAGAESLSPTVLAQLQLHLLALRHRLLSEKSQQPKARILIIACIMWVTLITTNVRQRRELDMLSCAENLKEGLSSISETKIDGDEQVYAWILSIGAMSTESPFVNAWFSQKLSSLLATAEFPKTCRSEEGLRKLSRGFLYFDDIQGGRLDALAQDLSVR